ncbi:MAG: carbohydrate binding domain-containing protein [Kiritimatiellaeota bacterium]|nr:carbohydrate binding domain-containing protein [Kiritimatiellota bacterium]
MKLRWMIMPLMCLLIGGCGTGKGGGGTVDAMVSVPDLSSYAKIGLLEKPTIVNPQFEGTAGWKLLEGYQIDPKGGRNGGGALFYERTDPAKYPLLGQDISLQPGIRYKFGVWVKTECVANESGGATICLEFYKNGKWIAGQYPAGIEGTKDWTRVESVGTVPADAERAELELYLRPQAMGKAWFDDVTIEPEKPRMITYMIQPAMESISSKDGHVLLGLYLDSFYCKLPDTIKEADLIVRVEALSGGKVVSETASFIKDGRIAADVGRLPEGAASLRVTMLDTRHKWIMGEESIPVTVTAGRQPPANACLLDSRGRMIVNGKPFLPVGLYHGTLTRKDVDIIAKSPFNCVMPYNSLSMGFKDSQKKGTEGIQEIMDFCQTKKLKIIFSIKDVYAETTYAPTTLGVEGESAIVEKAVTSFKNHPALLAWYVNDELPTSMLDRLTARRREVNRLDPFHPTWAVFCDFNEVPAYGPTCDIVGVDPYPIRDANSHDMELVRLAMEMTKRAVGTTEGMATWAVPQIFNWGCYDKKAKEDRKAYESTCRDPTESEMISMSLLCAIMGAKGFIYYSYFDLKKKVSVPDYGRRWPEVCRMGELMVSLAPFLLADSDGPAVTVNAESGKIMAKAFKDDKGSVRVLIAGIGPGDSKATLTVSSSVPLKSKFGKCVSLRNGQYRFQGADICSDILEGE